VPKLTKAVFLLLALLLALGASPTVAADQLLPQEAYSWTPMFAEPGQYPYSPSWRLQSPFQTKQGASNWKAVSVPFNQPGLSADDPYLENPHRGLDFAYTTLSGTSVYAVAYGRIVSVTPEGSAGYGPRSSQCGQ